MKKYQFSYWGGILDGSDAEYSEFEEIVVNVDKIIDFIKNRSLIRIDVFRSQESGRDKYAICYKDESSLNMFDEANDLGDFAKILNKDMESILERDIAIPKASLEIIGELLDIKYAEGIGGGGTYFDIERLSEVVDSIDRISSIVLGVDEQDFMNDKKSQSALLWELCLCGEIAKRIPDDRRDDFIDIPLRGMAKSRGKLIHQYFKIDLVIAWNSAQYLISKRREFEKGIEDTRERIGNPSLSIDTDS